MNDDFRNRTDPKSLLLRWDAQQTGFIEFRAECFDAMARIVSRAGGDSPGFRETGIVWRYLHALVVCEFR